MTVRVIALGNPMGGDDGAALRAAALLTDEPGTEIILAGRPGPGLVDLLGQDTPVVLLDVVRRGAAPGRIVELPLARLPRATSGHEPLSSHGLGVAESLRLSEALGRPIPPGRFVGIGGRSFGPGDRLSPEVASALGELVEATRAAVIMLERRTPIP